MTTKLTKHAKNKLKTIEARKLKLTKNKLVKALSNPISEISQPGNVIVSVVPLNSDHSLCVVHKTEDDIITIITFFPAKRGRYETTIQ